MIARNSGLAVTLAVATVWLMTTGAAARATNQSPGDSDGWQIPVAASTEANPIAATAEVVARGKALFRSYCQRCHGAFGKGDGLDADSAHRPSDLTDGRRASRNPDGVLFYKIWNGRAKPRMPAMKTDLSRSDVWTLIHYIKTLRAAGLPPTK